MRKSRALFLSVVIVLVFSASLLRAQATECSEQEASVLLQPTDGAYTDAIELGRVLSDHGFTIRCILTSKMGALFDGLEGAALYRTNFGDFDALFLTSPQTFAGLKVIERQAKKTFVYSFAGKPRPSRSNHLESVRRVYFLKHENQMLVLTDDELRAKLQDALNLPRE